MLAAETPFPHPGSWALVDVNGSTHVAKILSSHRDGTVTIALDAVLGASGNRKIPATELTDPTPLTLHEEGEMDRLDREIRRTKRPDRKKLEAWTKLRTRMINAATLGNLRAVSATRRVA